MTPNVKHAPAQAGRLRLPLAWTLLALLLAVSLVPLFLTSWMMIDVARESLESATREIQLQVAGSLASRFDATVASGGGHAGQAAEALKGAIQRLGGRPGQEEIRAILLSHLADDVLLMRYTSADGRMIQVGDAKGNAAAELQARFLDIHEATLATGTAQASAVRLTDEGSPGGPRPGAIVASPVGPGKAGAVAALLDLGSAWRRGVEDASAEYALFAFEPSGGLFARSNIPQEVGGAELKKLDIVKRFLTSGIKLKEATTVAAASGLFGGNELLGATAPTEYGWGVFVLVDRSLAYNAAREMREEVFRWSLFAVALAAIAAFVAAGWVTRPLKALVEGARRLGRGDFGSPVRVASRSEIGELADTFNHMSEEIQTHIQSLNAAAEEHQQLFLGSIRALAAAIDEKDPYTSGHSERVHRYAVAIARHLRLPQQDLRNIMIAALLHDVGKIGIEDAILRKPAALTDKEFEVMKRHPEKGSHIMDAIPQMRPILAGIRNHHERWSGGGYPDNLRGEEIPLVARVVQIADTFDAMTTNRPYQRAMKFEAAVARIRELSGIVFDPKVVDAFQSAWVAGDLKAEPRPVSRSEAAPPPAGAGA